MDKDNLNSDDSEESNKIDITTPQGMEQVQNIFDEYSSLSDNPINSDLEKFWFAGNLDTFLVTDEHTNGEYSLFDLYIPIGGQTRGHFHTQEDEVFKVVEGTIAFQEGTEVIVAHPGDSIFLSRENFHYWKNIGNEPARMLLLTTPSGFETAVKEGGESPITDFLQPPAINPSKFQRALVEHGIESYLEAELIDKPAITDGGEALYGDETNETITGDSSSNIILGRNGQDQLLGMSGHDILIGGSNEDLLEGGEGDDLLSSRESNDYLIGGAGKDTLTGGDGYDILTGGLGDDLFRLESDADADYITDFQDKQDLIGLSQELTFEDLTIIQGSDANAGDTVISLASNNQYLAILTEVDANTITSEDFQNV